MSNMRRDDDICGEESNSAYLFSPDGFNKRTTATKLRSATKLLSVSFLAVFVHLCCVCWNFKKVFHVFA